MSGMTLRLTDTQRARLLALAGKRNTSGQRLIVDLIEAECDREGIYVESHGSALDGLLAALGNPPVTDEHREAARRMLAEARREGERIYGATRDGRAAAA